MDSGQVGPVLGPMGAVGEPWPDGDPSGLAEACSGEGLPELADESCLAAASADDPCLAVASPGQPS